MNTIDLINNLSVKHDITSGRAEMIVSIIVERLVEKLKKEGEVRIMNFGTFRVLQKQPDSGSFLKLSEPVQLARNLLGFVPDKVFIETINSQ
ncbi:MAG: HU family DNA-binding protein [Ignavibacteria bacterium]|nr:HU family DNA-binding protein [Ignavibacteria bacterium]